MNRRMSLGRLNTPLKIWRLMDSGEKNQLNESVKSWTLTVERRFSISESKGSEFFSADRKNNTAVYELGCRFESGLLTVDDELRDSKTGAVYIVVAPPVDVDNRHRHIVCLCEIRSE